MGLIGVGEELGWRGWLLPTLASERRFAAAAALTGLAWTLWHLPVFFSGVALALSYLCLLISLSILQAWLWVRTQGSIGVAALAHGSVNAPFFFTEAVLRKHTNGAAITATAFAFQAALYSALAIVAVASSRDIWLQRTSASVIRTFTKRGISQ